MPSLSASERLRDLVINENSYCTAVACGLLNTVGEGKVVVFAGREARWGERYSWGGPVGPMIQVGKDLNYAYHSVYTDGKYIFDPFVSSAPIAKSSYLDMLRMYNSDGFSWRILAPETNQLLRSGF